jgi:hypothetical protein
MQLLKSEKEIAMLCMNSSVLNDELQATKVNLRTKEQTNREISNVID